MDFMKKLLGPSMKERFQRDDEKQARKNMVYSQMKNRDLLNTYHEILDDIHKGKGLRVSLASFDSLEKEIQKRGLKK